MSATNVSTELLVQENIMSNNLSTTTCPSAFEIKFQSLNDFKRGVNTITAVIISVRLTMACAVFAVSEICCLARACVGAYGIVTVGIDVTVM